MNQQEINNLVNKGYKPCFFSGVRENGGVFNEKNGAWNEGTGVFLHGVASIGDASFKGDLAGRGESMCGYLFATKVENAGEFGRLGIRGITWYGDPGFDEVNARKSFTRGAGAQASAGAASAPAVGAGAGAGASAQAPTPAPAPAVASTAAPGAGTAQAQPVAAPGVGAVDASGLLGAFIGSLAPAVTSSVMAQIEPRLNELASAACYKQEITIKHLDGSVSRVSGVVHPLFDTLIKMLPNEWNISGFIPYLYGPAGTGKNVLCAQLAAALGVESVVVSRPDMPFNLVGSEGIHGYTETPFVHALVNGGLCCFDEVDTWPRMVMEKIHDGLANGVWDIPTLGNIKQHKDFYLVMAGNTAGRGSSGGFKRDPLDPATCRRVCSFFMDYDERIELNCCGGDREMLDFFHDLRRASLECEIRVLTSLSEMSKLRGLVAIGVALHDAMKAAFIADLDTDSINCIYGAMRTKGSTYCEALKMVVADRKY